MSDIDVADSQRGAPDGAILTTDASPEGEQCAAAMRVRGYHVIDVPLSLLEARAIGEAPRVIVIDIDQPGAIDAVERLRDLPAGAAAELICVGDAERSAQLGLDAESGRSFERPIDRERLLALVAELAQPARRAPMRGTTPPPSFAPRRDTAAPPYHASEPPGPPSDFPVASDPLDETLGAEGSFAPEAIGPVGVSPELEQLLREAEERVAVETGSAESSRDDEVDLLLSADMLGLLDEPLDVDDEESASGTGSSAAEAIATGTPFAGKPQTGAAGTGVGTGPGVLQTGPGPVTTHARTNVGDPARDFAFERTPPPVHVAQRPETQAGVDAHGQAGPRPPTIGEARAIASSAGAAFPTLAPPEPSMARPGGAGPQQPAPAGEAWEPPPVPEASPFSRAAPMTRTGGYGGENLSAPEMPLIPAVLGDGDALRALARAISGRVSGALALGAEPALRRVVLREGDVVTAASSASEETLVAFLVARGDLERDGAARLAGKLPPFGRHAGAALIAHGHLGQDDLWPVLRAHAEWIIARAVSIDEGTCELEVEPPGRLRAEPNVFGGATGAEVVVEIARRTFAPDVALRRLGGPRARLEPGPRASLLAECALRAEEEETVRGARGKTVGEALASADAELANVLYVLAALDVFEVLAPAKQEVSSARGGFDPLDEEALRQRVRARASLVQEGDYFSLLGVARGATGYEIRRAYLELRRGFEPARILTAATADLADDVRLIVEVLDEAYDILREPMRRERYRRAIEAGPP